MKYIEAPDRNVVDGVKLFLAGGISNVKDWQTVVVNRLQDMDVTILNPRRKDFPMHITSAAQEQIEWEFEKLREADGILFWFPKETLCPIVLFELGSAMERGLPVWVGTDPEYERRQDVVVQTELRKPFVEVWGNLEHLIEDVRDGLFELGVRNESIGNVA